MGGGGSALLRADKNQKIPIRGILFYYLLYQKDHPARSQRDMGDLLWCWPKSYTLEGGGGGSTNLPKPQVLKMGLTGKVNILSLSPINA